MIIPFINFAGQAGEAIALYETVFDIQNKRVAFYKDMPADMKQHFPKEAESYILHAEMTINGTEVWIGDTMQGITSSDMVSLSVPFSSQEEIRTAFDKLKTDGKVLMELTLTFFSPLFGTVEDKFGVIWHFICR